MSFLNECFDFMDSHGLGVSNTNKINCTGDIERYCVAGDKVRSLNGWMIYRDDLKPSCTFGSWKTGEIYTWFAEDIKELPKAEQQKIKKELMQSRVKAKKLRDEEIKKTRLAASVEAVGIWGNSADDYSATHNHQYVQSKNINPYFCKLEESTGALIIPMLNQDNKLSSVQRIYPNGKKMFLPGGMIQNCFMELTDECKEESKNIFICEGWATGCTLHQITKQRVVVCYNANNLESVVGIIKMRYPDYSIFICADNDHQTTINGILTNVGEIKANEAARKHSVNVIYYGTEKHGTDWNDYHCIKGFDEVCAWFDFRLSATLRGEPEYV